NEGAVTGTLGAEDRRPIVLPTQLVICSSGPMERVALARLVRGAWSGDVEVVPSWSALGAMKGAALGYVVAAAARPAAGAASPAIRELLDGIERLAATLTPVAVTGESGTGKELVARALHFCSRRAEGPFIAINCAAIPETLFEAELFGYQRGAFTGAVSARAG